MFGFAVKRIDFDWKWVEGKWFMFGYSCKSELNYKPVCENQFYKS